MTHRGIVRHLSMLCTGSEANALIEHEDGSKRNYTLLLTSWQLSRPSPLKSVMVYKEDNHEVIVTLDSEISFTMHAVFITSYRNLKTSVPLGITQSHPRSSSSLIRCKILEAIDSDTFRAEIDNGKELLLHFEDDQENIVRNDLLEFSAELKAEIL